MRSNCPPGRADSLIVKGPLMADTPYLTERRLFGTVAVTAISDGTLKSAFDAYHHVSEAELRQALHLPPEAQEPVTHCIVFLVEAGDRRILIDTGSGVHVDETAGKLEAVLASLGVGLEDIDTILLTHTDNDHVGGAMRLDGTAVYPKATLTLHQAEEAFRVQGHFDRATMTLPDDLNRAALEAYTGRRATFVGGAVAPGVEAVPLPGHKPGHTGYLVGDGDTRLFIWGDTVHLPEVQMQHPEITTIYDIDEPMAEVSRRRAFEMAIQHDYVVSGMHLRWPPFVRVKKAGAGYGIVPDQN